MPCGINCFRYYECITMYLDVYRTREKINSGVVLRKLERNLPYKQCGQLQKKLLYSIVLKLVTIYKSLVTKAVVCSLRLSINAEGYKCSIMFKGNLFGVECFKAASFAVEESFIHEKFFAHCLFLLVFGRLWQPI